MKYIYKIIKFILFFIKFDGVVFIAPFPYKELEKNGYFKRIKSIDIIFNNIKRIYIDTTYNTIQNFSQSTKEQLLKYNSKSFIIYNNDCYILNINQYNYFIFIFISLMFIIRSRIVYFHSIYRVSECLGFILYFPFITKILDIHGAVPEEYVLYNNNININLNKIEEKAINKVNICITVTENMKKHLKNKYIKYKSKFLTLPIMPLFDFDINKYNVRKMLDVTTYNNKSEKVNIVYIGGAQPWQQISKMASLIKKTIKFYQYTIFTNVQDIFESLFLKYGINGVKITKKEHKDILKLYHKFDYGLILRSQNIVNKVACPTKLVEYLAFGVIPIVDSPDIGDFLDLGMRYVHMEDLERGRLPSQQIYEEMHIHNRLIYEKMLKQYQKNSQKLRSFINIDNHFI